MKLPNGQNADLGSKLEDYCLNAAHPRGQHKARLFDLLLGITENNKQTLVSALYRAAASSPDAILSGENGFGETYVLEFDLTTEKGTARVLSAWIIRRGEDFPRLTTCYIL